METPLSAEAAASRDGAVAVRWLGPRRAAWIRIRSGRAELVRGDPAADHGADHAADHAAGGAREHAAVIPVEVLAPHHRATIAPTPEGGLVVATATGALAILSARGEVTTAAVPDGLSPAAPAVSPDGRRLALVGETTDRCDVFVADLAELVLGRGELHRVSDADFAYDPAWSPDGRLVWHEWDLPAMPWEASRVALHDVLHDGGGTRIVAGGPDRAVGQPRFSPDGSRLAFVSDATGWMRPWVGDRDGRDAAPLGGRVAERRDGEDAEPTWGPGQRSYAWSPDGRSLAWCRGTDGVGALHVQGVMEGDGSIVGSGWHRSLDWGPAGLVAVRSDPGSRPEPVALDPTRRGQDSRRRSQRPRQRSHRPTPERLRWTSADLARVHGTRWPPTGSVPRPPLLVIVHGGPNDQARVDWWPRADFFRDRGWAVLTPDHRGSTGYGRAYTQALEGHWGERDVDDVAAAIGALVAAGEADPRRVALSGGSAGGFTALLVAIRRPELCAAVAVRYPVTDLRALASSTHRFESGSTATLVGAPPSDESVYEARSPLSQVDRLRAPLLVFRGEHDPVVPPEQVDALVDARRAAGGVVESVVYPGEGHGFRRPEHVADELHRTEAFLRSHVLSTA